MRTLSTPALAALQARTVPAAVLIEMDLTSALNLCTSNINLVVSGTTYYGTRGLGRIGAAQNTPAEVRNLSFELSGVPSDIVALALNEPVQGKAVRLKLALLDPTSFAVLDAQPFWQGLLDTMNIADNTSGATITVTAEHAGIDLTRPASSFYTDAEQQALNPGDRFFQYTSTQVDQRIVWPDKTYGRK